MDTDSIGLALEEFLNDPDISPETKLSASKRIRGILNDYLASLQQLIPSEAPVLWPKRHEEDITPTEFVQKYYGESLAWLSMHDVRRLDFKLYTALTAQRDRLGWPEGFHLPAQDERTDFLIDQLATGIPEVQDLVILAGSGIRYRRREEVRRRRRR